MSTTFGNDEHLPRLPVPLLQLTARQLLGALKPLLLGEEFMDVYAELAQFEADPTVQLIQRHLQAAADHPSITCYLNAVNDESWAGIYGELRGDTLPRNPYLVLEEDPYSKALHPPNMVERAANLVNLTLKFVVAIRNETLKADTTPKNGNPLTMRCYRNLFGTTRVPGAELGSHNHVTIHKYKEFNDSRHIVVICNNQFYKLEVLTRYTEEEYAETQLKHKIWFSDHELLNVLALIVAEALMVDQITANQQLIGPITTQTFGTWCEARAELMRSNPTQLRAIDDALFVLVLDHTLEPVTDEEKTICISHGTSRLMPGTNIQRGTCTLRWYDKLQVIVTQNAVAGVVWELALMDLTAILRFISDIYTDLVLKLAKNINGKEYTLFDPNVSFVLADGKNVKPDPHLIKFDLTPELATLVRLLETRLADLVTQHQYNVFSLKLESFLLKKVGVSVDLLLQVAFQVANYLLYGRMVNTLEPITTRKFRDLRTELIPVQNDYVTNLVKLYITNTLPEDKWDWFKKCCDIHLEQYRDAMAGRGFERHLGAILQVFKRREARARLNKLNPELEPIPDIATFDHDIPLMLNPLLLKIFNPELLISNCGNPALHLFGIPPATDQGYGIGYIIQKDRVMITACSKYRQADRFMHTLARVVDDLKRTIKQRSDFVLNINDLALRKVELQRLRIEKELKHTKLDLVALRRPIELTMDREPDDRRYEYADTLVKLPKQPTPTIMEPAPLDATITGVLEASARERNRGRLDSLELISSEEDYDILGGYGYFDIGEVDVRLEEISRAELYLNLRTTSQFQLRYQSRHQLRRNLNLDLPRLALDIKDKMLLSEKIRDRLRMDLDDNLMPPRGLSLLPERRSPLLPRELSPLMKARVGRALDMSHYT